MASDGSHLKPYQIKPGEVRNPGGRPKSVLTKLEIEGIFGRFARMQHDELEAFVQNKKNKAIEVATAAVLLKAMQGDSAAYNFLLDRSIGRVSQEIKLELPKPTVIEKLDGSKIIAGIAAHSEVVDVAAEEVCDEPNQDNECQSTYMAQHGLRDDDPRI